MATKKKAPLKMNLPTGGAVILDYEVRVGTKTGLYHVTARSGTEFLYTKEEIKDKVTEGTQAQSEPTKVVDVDDILK